MPHITVQTASDLYAYWGRVYRETQGVAFVSRGERFDRNRIMELAERFGGAQVTNAIWVYLRDMPSAPSVQAFQQVVLASRVAPSEGDVATEFEFIEPDDMLARVETLLAEPPEWQTSGQQRMRDELQRARNGYWDVRGGWGESLAYEEPSRVELERVVHDWDLLR